MLSNGWYWSGRGHEVMAYPIVGWEVRCRWERVAGGEWAMSLTATEEDPAPWLPGKLEDPATVTVRPEIDGRSEWRFPDPKAMEEMSRRVGLHRVRQVIACCRSHTGSTQVSN